MRTSGFLSPAFGGARGWVLLSGMMGAAALALCSASPSVYPGKAKVKSLADTAPLLSLVHHPAVSSCPHVSGESPLFHDQPMTQRLCSPQDSESAWCLVWEA